jgi:hypothetical protein
MISVFRDIKKNGTYIITISDVEGEIVPPIFGWVDLSHPNVSERLDLNDAVNLIKEAAETLIGQYEPEIK